MPSHTGRLDREMLCGERFIANGQLRLVGAHIGTQLSFDGGKLTRRPLALALRGARVDDSLLLRFADRPRGAIDLGSAHLGRLLDSKQTWPDRLQLQGCVYTSLQAAEDGQPASNKLSARLTRLWKGPPDVRRRLDWIRLSEKGWEDVAPYSPQPYTQLMDFYRREGRDGDARRVAYERENRRRGQLGPLGKAWNWFLRLTVGYGYKPLRALGWFVALAVVGALVFSSFHSHGKLDFWFVHWKGHLRVPADGTKYPPFDAFIYTVDRMIPTDFLSFGLRDTFIASGAAQGWAFAYGLLGWVLIIAVVAGITAAVRRN